ncbi:MAG: GspH/FimT family pseudopilin [Pseudomonadota bacterium]|nr:GspH/FimT family pseudopilin [Pseudomonadota bacterium]
MQRTAKGFTIVELMITMIIAALLLGFATPSFVDLMEKNRVRTTSQQLVELLRLSRLIAVEHRNLVSVCGSSDSANCDNDWTSSILSVKRGEDGAADEIMASLNVSEKVAISKTNNNANNPNIDFRVSGWTPWDQTTFTLCPVDGKQKNAYQVTVSGSGKVKLKPNKEDSTWC